MLMQPTTIAAAQAAGSPYFWDNGQKKLAVTAEQLAQFKAGGQYDPTGGSALTQWANLNTKPINPSMINTQMDLQPRLDIPRQTPPRDFTSYSYSPPRAAPRQRPEPSRMDRFKEFLSGLIPEGRTESGVVRRGFEIYPEHTEQQKAILERNIEGMTPKPATFPVSISGQELNEDQYRAMQKRMASKFEEDGPFRTEGMTPNRPYAFNRGRAGTQRPVSYSQVAMDKIAEWEGFRDTPYDDVGTQRIGYGREAGSDKTTTVEAERGDLMTKIQDIGDWLDGVVTADLNANQKAALTSLVYNVGKGSFKKSKALKALNEGDMDEFRSQAFSKNKGWVKSKGKFLKGLYNRRMKEQALFDG
jgi:GH24 family phage-related lysozyme (muramidase)